MRVLRDRVISTGLNISRKVVGKKPLFYLRLKNVIWQKFYDDHNLERSKMLYEFLGDFFNKRYLSRNASDMKGSRLQFKGTVKTSAV